MDAWGKKALFPCKQQPENNPNHKTKQHYSQNMGWEHTEKPKHKERKT
jgi:hypothetical protein